VGTTRDAAGASGDDDCVSFAEIGGTVPAVEKFEKPRASRGDRRRKRALSGLTSNDCMKEALLSVDRAAREPSKRFKNPGISSPFSF